MRLVFDIEADGLLLDASRIWCIVAQDLDTDEVHTFGPDKVREGYEFLRSAERLIAHNGRMYDVPVLDSLCGRVPLNRWAGPRLPGVVDTLLISRLVYPDRYTNPIHGHSLAAWGRFFKFPKGEHTDFTKYSPEMLEYCKQDVKITAKVFRYLYPKACRMANAVALEHKVADIITQQIINGFGLDSDAVDVLRRQLETDHAEAQDELGYIPPFVDQIDFGETMFGRDTKPKYTEFNPNSPKHIIRLFREKYGWEPPLVKRKNKSKDEEVETESCSKEVLDSLDFSEAKVLSRLRLIKNRISQMQGWLDNQRNGVVHGDVITNGTISGRMAHSSPNINVPKVGKPYGELCRSCFRPTRRGWVQVGADGSGMQARMLAHYLHRWDNGAYVEVVLGDDIHTANQQLAGLETRDQAKTTLYLTFFGGGPGKLSRDLKISKSKAKKIIDKFKDGIRGIRQLIAKLERDISSTGGIVGLDGRFIPVQLVHTALANLLQNAEAVVMKQALVLFYQYATETYGPHGERWALMANVHDEYQAECEPEIADGLGQLMVKAISDSGKHWKLNVRLDGEYKIGNNWRACH